MQECLTYIDFFCQLVKNLIGSWFGFNRGHFKVSTSSSVEAMSIPFYQVTAVTAESFVVPVLDVFLTPQYAN